ncbi:DEAD/DEAH box helicase [Halomonas sp. G15]|uniref:SNF2-related protein n=1 Tax=Halomonas sp. G15 TaxID=2903521 RepID=UPI001E36214A|nr:DEAD/DEAH box helicase [Halomonas sp. G15]MCE0733729.1 DEAD/DEAH box helicase [Halomonas sp. G15]
MEPGRVAGLRQWPALGPGCAAPGPHHGAAVGARHGAVGTPPRRISDADGGNPAAVPPDHRSSPGATSGTHDPGASGRDAGALGSQQWFGQRFRAPIEKDSDVELRQCLSRHIAPLMLRRTKQQVLTELPEMTETRREVSLSGAQRELYESLRLASHQRVQQAVAERGLAGSGIVMLDALLKLRQVCCDPRLVKLESARKAQRSAKLDQLRELVPPLVEEGRRILIFSQFTEMLALISETLEKHGICFTT